MFSRKIIFLSIFALVILGGVIFKLTSITQYHVITNGVSCINSSQIESELGLKDKNYFLIDFAPISQLLKSKYVCIKDVDYRFEFPQKLNISLNKRIPMAKLVLSDEAKDLSLREMEASPSTSSSLLNFRFNESTNSGDFLIVDSEGVVFEQSEGGFLPNIFIDSSDLKVGSFLDKSTFEGISNVQSKLSNLGLGFTESKIISNYLLVNGAPRLIFDLVDDVNKQLISLQLILNKARMDNSEIESIDLRFKNPVVIYSDKKTNNLKKGGI